jgi:hypothetical protein
MALYWHTDDGTIFSFRNISDGLQGVMTQEMNSSTKRVIVWINALYIKFFEATGSGEDYITRNLMLCTPHQILFGWSNQEDWDGQGM